VSSRRGFDIHFPQRDGIEVATVMDLLNDQDGAVNLLPPPLFERAVTWVTRAVVALDVFQAVEECECVVLNLDGRVPDEGSLVEATLAWYAG